MTTSAPPRESAPSPQTRRIVLGALALGLLFEVVNLIGTQDKAVYRSMPWHDDPYHAVVLAGVFTVAILVVAIAARMLVWSAPGGADWAWQMARAAGVLVAVVAIAAGFQWVSVAVHAHGRAWNGSTTLQIAALGVTSAAALAVGLGLARAKRAGRRRAYTDHDWLGDAMLLVARIPALGRAATPDVVVWIRHRAVLVFAAASVLAAAPVVAAQAIGEGITDPVVIAWFETVLAATLFAFCMIANAVAGIVARPPRSAARSARSSRPASGSRSRRPSTTRSGERSPDTRSGPSARSSPSPSERGCSPPRSVPGCCCSAAATRPDGGHRPSLASAIGGQRPAVRSANLSALDSLV